MATLDNFALEVLMRSVCTMTCIEFSFNELGSSKADLDEMQPQWTLGLFVLFAF